MKTLVKIIASLAVLAGALVLIQTAVRLLNETCGKKYIDCSSNDFDF